MRTQQMEFWLGEFGKQYTDRNTLNPSQLNQLYFDSLGITRDQMNSEMLGSLPKDIRILEIGSNIGQQLEGLRRLNFSRLFGIELQWYAVEYLKNHTKDMTVLQGSGLEIPFKTSSFGLVFTSGVLIHIAPENIPIFMGEIYRVTSQYIWGFEYYAEKYTDINYRGNIDVLWKADFASIFLSQYPDLTLVQKKLYPYTSQRGLGNIDCMYLLKKSNK
jgi:pseudaminic acid biosynthesis-associated methylase